MKEALDDLSRQSGEDEQPRTPGEGIALAGLQILAPGPTSSDDIRPIHASKDSEHIWRRIGDYSPLTTKLTVSRHLLTKIYSPVLSGPKGVSPPENTDPERSYLGRGTRLRYDWRSEETIWRSLGELLN